MKYATILIDSICKEIDCRITDRMPIEFEVSEGTKDGILYASLSIDFDSNKGLLWCSSVLIKDIAMLSKDGSVLSYYFDEIELQEELRTLINKRYEIKGY
jgi:hypothetical protein